ncbi:hypothetical protein [Microbacterium gorillae]|uniref:hypothetical protein n=1 Tax=Microbacterium gorillae TaxID=1231063 RepID=UPI00058F633C|nr:hypothetical protein [Microbacterium gorillae]
MISAGEAGSKAFTAVGLVIRSLPADIRANLATVTATTADDVTLTLADSGVTIVWGSAEQSVLKAEVLAVSMKARPPGVVTHYDVSSPTAVVMH